MKKLLLIITVIASMIGLTSCFGGNNDQSSGGGNGTSTDPYSAIITDGGKSYDLTDVISLIKNATGKMLTVKLTGATKDGREILIGDTDRVATAEGKSILADALSDAEWSDTGYVIYAKDGDLAICWENKHAADDALTRLAELAAENGSLNFKDGLVAMDTFSFIDKMEAEEALMREAELDAIEALYDKEVRDAVEAHLAIYGEEFYLWLANLYDPGEYDAEGNPLGGGFYYSNSARDNYGYLIDIESTTQALYLIKNMDMLVEYNGSYQDALPEKMQKELIAFAQSLQSPVDGYFYHPQWGTAIKTSRQSRDLGWATTLLEMLGSQPFYNAPDGTKGMYGPPPGTAMTQPLKNSGAVAVSKVVATATKWTAQLETLDAWKEYIDAFAVDINTKSYSIGNTIASQDAQILNREKEAIKAGEITDADGDGIAEDGYIMAVKSFFDKYQLENGVWAEGSVEDGTITYAATNGLMKISVAYNGLGLIMPRAEEAFHAALYIAMLEGPDCQGVTAEDSVDVYNAFTGMQNALNSLKKSGSTEKYKALKAELAANAAEMIRVTTAKCIRFRKPDGSYAYNAGPGGYLSQGVPVCVPGMIEGTINGGGGAYVTSTERMFNLLDIDVRFQYASDFEKFLHALEGATHIVKEEIIIPPTTYDFEDEEIGSNTVNGINSKMESGYVEVAKDPAEDGAHETVLKFVAANAEKGDSLYTTPTGSTSGATCYIYEFDLYISDYVGKNTAVFRIRLRDAKNIAYTLIIRYQNGKFIIGDHSEGDIKENFTDYEFNPNEWHNIRVEHYTGTAETVRTKIFLDDTLIKTSTNYYGNDGTGNVAPHTAVNQLHIYSYYTVMHETYFDNVFFTATNDTFVEGDTPLDTGSN